MSGHLEHLSGVRAPGGSRRKTRSGPGPALAVNVNATKRATIQSELWAHRLFWASSTLAVVRRRLLLKTRQIQRRVSQPKNRVLKSALKEGAFSTSANGRTFHSVSAAAAVAVSAAHGGAMVPSLHLSCEAQRSMNQRKLGASLLRL